MHTNDKSVCGMDGRKTTISRNGGAVRYWRRNGERACECKNGQVLLLVNGRWVELGPGTKNIITLELGWKPDTRSRMSGAITRTTRQARRDQ